MTNNLRSLDDVSIAYMNDDSWVWKDDMIVFPREDDFYAAEEDRRAELLHQLATEAHEMIWGASDEDHPICGEFPHDSIVAPRGWDKVG